MFNKVKKGLKAWVRYDGNNNAVAGSLIFQKDKPKVGKWKEFHDVNLCCPSSCSVDYGSWKLVSGGVAGDGAVLVDDLENNGFTFIGPNDRNSNGWVYLKKYFPAGAILEIDYNWTSFDEGTSVDRPVYWTSSTEPNGIPSDITSKASATPENGTWNVPIPPGEWFAIGVYSTDSCCGRGFLFISIN